MEFLAGESLRAAIEGGRAGNTSERVRIAREAAKALAYVHSLKLVHRDIKPENIFVNGADKVRLMDFGIAALSGEGTKDGSAAGTPYYMAPEQALGRPLTAQADVYSFGVVMYELFTGKKPFVGDTVEKIFEQVIYKPIDLELLAKSDAPQVVRELVAKCTAKKLMERPETMAPVYEALEKASAPAAAVEKVVIEKVVVEKVVEKVVERLVEKAAAPAMAPSEPGKLSPSNSENYIRLGVLPQPDPNAPPAPKITPQTQNATTSTAKPEAQGSQMKSLVMAAGGAVLVAFLIYVVVRLSGAN
jgi:serine/threonine protein kinase